LTILVSAVLFLSCGQTESNTDADNRYTHATTVGVTNALHAHTLHARMNAQRYDLQLHYNLTVYSRQLNGRSTVANRWTIKA